jgi:hypothetical protein
VFLKSAVLPKRQRHNMVSGIRTEFAA